MTKEHVCDLLRLSDSAYLFQQLWALGCLNGLPPGNTNGKPIAQGPKL